MKAIRCRLDHQDMEKALLSSTSFLAISNASIATQKRSNWRGMRQIGLQPNLATVAKVNLLSNHPLVDKNDLFAVCALFVQERPFRITCKDKTLWSRLKVKCSSLDLRVHIMILSATEKQRASFTMCPINTCISHVKYSPTRFIWQRVSGALTYCMDWKANERGTETVKLK